MKDFPNDFAPEDAKPPAVEEKDWRADPAWELVQFDRAFWEGRTPPAKPPADAELAQPGLWSSLYAGRPPRAIATWYRPVPAAVQPIPALSS